MPLKSTLGALTVQYTSLGAGGQFFYGELQTPENTSKSIACDTDGNFYIAGRFDAAPGPSIDGSGYLLKFNNNSGLVWQRRIQVTSTFPEFNQVEVDSAGNVQAVGYQTVSRGILSMFNAAGSTGYQRYLTRSGSNKAITINGNIKGASQSMYITGSVASDETVGNVDATYVARLTSSGTVSWSRILNTVVASDRGNNISLNPTNDNVYITGVASATNIHIGSFNSAGTSNYQTYWSIPSAINTNATSISTDNFGNSYVCGSYTLSGTQYAFVIKINSSGTIVWAKNISNIDLFDIVVDTVGNSYAVGWTFASGFGGSYIISFDGSGTLRWQRKLQAPSIMQGINLDPFGNYIITGYDAPDNSVITFAKFPTNGRILNPIGDDTFYTASTLTISTITLNAETGPTPGTPFTISSTAQTVTVTTPTVASTITKLV